MEKMNKSKLVSSHRKLNSQNHMALDTVMVVTKHFTLKDHC